MERPTLAEDSLERRLLRISNHVFTTVFLMEMMIKGQLQIFFFEIVKIFFRNFQKFFRISPNKIFSHGIGILLWIRCVFTIWMECFGFLFGGVLHC